jgi:hypothetical protein
MPPRGIIETLPPEVRDELNRRLMASGYGRLEEQVAWLREQGVQIAKSAVGQYSQGLKVTMEKALTRARTRIEAAKALGGLSDGDKAALLEANEMVLLDKLMDIMDEWETVDPESRPKALAALIRASADLSGSARGTAKWRRDFEAEIRRQALEEAAARVDEAAKAQGLNEEQARFWREKVLMGGV